MAPPTKNSRFISIPGSLNFRDFGGYEPQDGKRIKRGLLFRSGMLTDIPASATDEFACLDIGVICDMRGLDEVALYPTPDSAAFDCQVHIPITPGTSQSLKTSLEQMQDSAPDRVLFMREITREIAREHVAAYALVLRALLETEQGFLIHCMAGNDRTGFGAALIKLALGVSMPLIVEDYLLTNQSTDLLTRTRDRINQQENIESLITKVLRNLCRCFTSF